MMTTSIDGGKSWDTSVRLPEGILGPIKDKPILIGSTLVCPSSTEDQGWRVHVEMTKDLGKSWVTIGPLAAPGIGAIQPTLINGTNGLLMLCRTKQKKIAKAWSKDGGKSWTDLSLIDLPNPNSGIDAVQLRDGRALLVYNDSDKKRTPLNIAISTDDGVSWKPGPVLESEPGEYSYPAVIQSADGLVHVTYTWHRQKIRHVVLDPKKIE
jgi:predicted neuraminidase